MLPGDAPDWTPHMIGSTRDLLRRPVGPAERLSRRRLRDGMRLYHIAGERFPTAWIRLVLGGRLDMDSTAVSLLGEVMRAACAATPTRQGLAHRLTDLYGASLDISPEKLGEHHRLAFQLAWPLPRGEGRRAAFEQGIHLLADLVHRPLRSASGALDARHTALERENLRRRLVARSDDPAREALDLALGVACEQEGYRWPAWGRLADLPGLDAERLADVHAQRLLRAPLDLLVVAPLPIDEVVAQVAPLLPEGPRLEIGSPVDHRTGASRVRERHAVRARQQSRIAMVWRAEVADDPDLLDAGDLVAGMLGASSASVGFRELREKQGLCYDISATWIRSKGLLLVQAGTDPSRVQALVDGVRGILARFLAGHLDAESRADLLAEGREHLRAMPDRPGARLRYAADAAWLGLPSNPGVQHRRLTAVQPEGVQRFIAALCFDTCQVVGRKASS